MVRTIATNMEIDVAAHNHFRNNNLRMPECLSADTLRHRYVAAAMDVKVDEHESPERLVFADGSVAERDVVDGYIWHEVKEDNDGDA